MGMSAGDMIRKLGLTPLPGEGGYFRETYRSSRRVPDTALPRGAGGDRDAATAIYYLLTRDTVSAMHRLRGDEVFHFYVGDPVEMLQLRPDGTTEVIVIGADLEHGMSPQVVVPGGVWQGSRLARGGEFALMGTTMAPGFDARDFELGDRAELLRHYPEHADLIRSLTADSSGGRG